MGPGYFPVMNHKKPPFDLPVLYEDDHFAIGTLSTGNSKCFLLELRLVF